MGRSPSLGGGGRLLRSSRGYPEVRQAGGDRRRSGGQRPGHRRRRRGRLRHGLAGGHPDRDAAPVRGPAHRGCHAAPGDLSRGHEPGAPARRLDRGPEVPPDGPCTVGIRAGGMPRRTDDRIPSHGLRAGCRGPREPDRLRRAAARRRRPGTHERAPAQRLAHRLPVDRARVDRRSLGLAHLLAPAAALGALEPARDPAQPPLAVATTRALSCFRPTS